MELTDSQDSQQSFESTRPSSPAGTRDTAPPNSMVSSLLCCGGCCGACGRCCGTDTQDVQVTDKVAPGAIEMAVWGLAHSKHPEALQMQLDAWEKGLRSRPRDTWKDIATLDVMKKTHIKRTLIHQLSLQRTVGLSDEAIQGLHSSCLKLLRKFRLRWDSNDKSLIKEALLYTIPLLHSNSSHIIAEATKFITSIIVHNPSRKTIDQKIQSCRMARYKQNQKDESLRQFLIGACTATNSTFFTDIKNLIEQGIAEIEHLRVLMETTDDLPQIFDPEPMRLVFQLLQSLCSRDDVLSRGDEIFQEKERLKLQQRDPILYQELLYFEEMEVREVELEQHQIQKYMHTQQSTSSAGNETGHDLVVWSVKFLKKLRHILSPTNVALVIQVHHTLLSFVEGCDLNIQCVVNANIADTMNGLLNQYYLRQAEQVFLHEDIKDLTVALLELLLGLVEGNPNTNVVRHLAARLQFEKPSESVLPALTPGQPEPRTRYVFDEWLPRGAKYNDIFSEGARVPVLFCTLIKILGQVDESEKYRRMATTLFGGTQMADGRRKGALLEIGHVEVITDKRQGTLQSVYFPLPAVCRRYNESSAKKKAAFDELKSHFVFENNKVKNWERATERIISFSKWAEGLLIELEHEHNIQHKLGGHSWIQRARGIAKSDSRGVQLAAFFLSLVINLLVLMAYDGDGFSWDSYRWRGVMWAIISLGIVHTVLAAIVLFTFLMWEGRIISLLRWSSYLSLGSHVKVLGKFPFTSNWQHNNIQNLVKTEAQRRKAVLLRLQQQHVFGITWPFRSKRFAKVQYFLWSTWYTIGSPTGLFFLAYFACSILGVCLSPFWFAFHPFYIFIASSELQVIIKSLQTTLGKLVLLAAVLVFGTYVFAIIAYFTLQMYFTAATTSYCGTVAECFVSLAQFGWTLQGALIQNLPNAALGDGWGNIIGLTIFYVCYWLYVGVIITSLILAIILDAFGHLRDQAANFKASVMQSCFICSIKRETFQAYGGRSMFVKHVENEHNLWHYLYFFAFLKHKHEAIKADRKALETEDHKRRSGKENGSEGKTLAQTRPEKQLHHRLRFSHIQREIFNKISSGKDEDILSFFPIERSQSIEELQKHKDNKGSEVAEVLNKMLDLEKKMTNIRATLKEFVSHPTAGEAPNAYLASSSPYPRHLAASQTLSASTSYIPVVARPQGQ